MRSIKTWGKAVEGVLNRGWISCSRLFTGEGLFTNGQVQVSGNVRVVRHLTVLFPVAFTQLRSHFNDLLISWFSLFSTPLIISETN